MPKWVWNLFEGVYHCKRISSWKAINQDLLMGWEEGDILLDERNDGKDHTSKWSKNHPPWSMNKVIGEEHRQPSKGSTTHDNHLHRRWWIDGERRGGIQRINMELRTYFFLCHRRAIRMPQNHGSSLGTVWHFKYWGKEVTALAIPRHRWLLAMDMDQGGGSASI